MGLWERMARAVLVIMRGHRQTVGADKCVIKEEAGDGRDPCREAEFSSLLELQASLFILCD